MCVNLLKALYVETISNNKKTDNSFYDSKSYEYEEYDETKEIKLPVRFSNNFANEARLNARTTFQNKSRPCRNDTRFFIAVDSANRNFQARERIRSESKEWMLTG